MTPVPAPVAVLGLGLIGSIWARHLSADGVVVRAWNRSPKPQQPGWTAAAADAVRGAAVVMIVVADGPAVLALVRSLLPVLVPGQIVCQHSTIGVGETRAVQQMVESTGASYLDMPFTGSKPAAESRSNVFFVGGDAAVHAQVQPLYARLAKEQFHVGEVGQAAALKLSFNLLIAGLNQSMAEALALAERAGIDPHLWFRALEPNVAKAPLADLKKPKLLARDWSPQFSVKHMAKDVRLAQGLAAGHGLELALAAAVERTFAAAESAGLADADFAAVADIISRRNP